MGRTIGSLFLSGKKLPHPLQMWKRESLVKKRSG
jgi:hypothetical protein